MRKSTDTLLRLLALLQMLPTRRARQYGTVEKFESRLQQGRFAVDKRTIQRDMNNLSRSGLPVTCVTEGRTKYWFWEDADRILHLPAMDANTALAFRLASDYLRVLLPPSALELLSPHIKKADEVLRQSEFGKWSAKTCIINRGPTLTPPHVNPIVRDVVYDALVTDRQFEVDYQNKSNDAPWRRVLSPLGLVVRDGVIYLIATSAGYPDERHYVLHRMSRAKVLDQRAVAPADFDFARYVAKSFDYPVTDQALRLRVLFAEGAAQHLSESRLSDDQKITPQKDGRVRIEATVADTAALRWWLLGFGDGVEVIAPQSLRDEFAQTAKAMAGMYARRGK